MAMEESESQNDFMQRLKSCSMTASTTTASLSSSIPVPRPNRLDLPSFSSSQSRPQFRHLPPSPDASKRIGIPPTHPHFSPSAAASPYPQISRSPSASQNLVPLPSHSRSLSQPAFFSLDSLPQFSSPSPPFVPDPPPPSSADVAMDDRAMPALLARTGSGSGSGRVQGDGLPPRKAHRRSQSDIPFGFLQNPSLPLPPPPHPSLGFPNHLISPREMKVFNQSVKKESEWERERDSSVERKSDGDVGGDDLFSAYMNLESLDTLNSSGTGTGTEEKREDSRASGTKTNNGADSSENEAESCSVNESGSSMGKGEMKDGNKRSAVGDPGVMGSRHNRSLSMDSFMGKLNFGEESPSATALQGPRVGQHMHSGSLDGTTNTFSLEFGSGEFSGAELKKIMANDKLAEIAMADPKRAKRILANRQSAARSKERKMRYISELEHKVQTLQSEATTLSAQLTLLQRDSAGFTSQNNELKFRLQAMEQQAQLRDALSEALTAEVQRLKLATGEAQLANSLNQQMQLNPNPQMYSLQHMQKQQQQQQSSQISHYQMQSEQLQGKNNDGANNEAHK